MHSRLLGSGSGSGNGIGIISINMFIRVVGVVSITIVIVIAITISVAVTIISWFWWCVQMSSKVLHLLKRVYRYIFFWLSDRRKTKLRVVVRFIGVCQKINTQKMKLQTMSSFYDSVIFFPFISLYFWCQRIAITLKVERNIWSIHWLYIPIELLYGKWNRHRSRSARGMDTCFSSCHRLRTTKVAFFLTDIFNQSTQ